MAVPIKDSVKINFSGGLDLKMDPKQIDASEFLVLNNSVFTVGGQLTKRNGFKGLGTSINQHIVPSQLSTLGTNITSARKLFAYNGELCLNDPWNLYSYNQSLDQWVYRGRSTMVGLSTENVQADISTYFTCDMSIDSQTGVKIFAYVDNQGFSGGQPFGNAYVSIQDIATGQFIYAKTQIASSVSSIRCVSVSGQSWVFYQTTTGTIDYIAIVGDVLGAGGFIINGTANAPWDMDIDPYTGNLYSVFAISTTSVRVALHAYNGAGVITTTSSVSNPVNGSGAVTFTGNGVNIYVTYMDSANQIWYFTTDLAVTSFSASTMLVAGSPNRRNITSIWSTRFNNLFTFYDSMIINGNGYVTTADIRYVVPGFGNQLLAGSVELNSKAFAIDGIPQVIGLYNLVSFESTNYPSNPALFEVIQPTNFLINVYNYSGQPIGGNTAGKVSQWEAQAFPPIKGILSSPKQYAATLEYDVALLQNSNNTAEIPPSFNPYLNPTGVINTEWNFGLTNPDVITLGETAIIATANPVSYDGVNVSEQNFCIYPQAVGSGTPANAGGFMGSATQNTLYSYIYVYEWIDAKGQVVRSATSPVITPEGNPIGTPPAYTFPSGTTTGQVTLHGPMLRITNKPSTDVVINIYRTVANGSVYFLLGSPISVVSGFGTVHNDPTVANWTYVDKLPDSDIIGNTQLYTTGALSYYAPTASRALSAWKNRAISVQAEYGFNILYSNQTRQFAPVEFVPEFVQNVGSVSGDIVTAVGMDDKLIIFKSGNESGPAILYMNGQGPAPSGANNDFVDPLPVAVDAGCVDRPSVVLTPVGLMFKSSKGVYLLDRGLTASYIGAPVETYNQFSVVTAQLIPDTTQVRFILSNGVMLMYDYFWKKWATFTPPAGISDCIFEGQHTYVSSSGQVYQEAPGTYVDLSTPVLMNFTTAWIKLAGLQGYQRSFFFYLLAQYLSPHKLQLQISYDFANSPSQTSIITPNTIDTLENWRVFLAKQRCQSFQISMQEIYTGTPGAAFTMSGLNLIVGMKSKFITISASQSVG